MLANAGQRDRARTWFASYVEAASTPQALARVRALLDGKEKADGLELDQEQRWDLVGQLNRYGVEGSEALLAAERARDPSEGGQLAAIAIEASRPDANTKAAWLARIQALPTTELPYAKLRMAMAALYPAGQEALAEQSAQARYDSLAAIEARADRVYMRSYANSMLEGTCSAESVQRLQALVASKLAVSDGTRRALEAELESDQRCLAIRARFAEALKK